MKCAMLYLAALVSASHSPSEADKSLAPTAQLQRPYMSTHLPEHSLIKQQCETIPGDSWLDYWIGPWTSEGCDKLEAILAQQNTDQIDPEITWDWSQEVTTLYDAQMILEKTQEIQAALAMVAYAIPEDTFDARKEFDAVVNAAKLVRAGRQARIQK